MTATAIGGFVFYFEEISKFYRSTVVRGWMHRENSSEFTPILSAQFVGFSQNEKWLVSSVLNMRQDHLMSGSNSFLVQGLLEVGNSVVPKCLRLEIEGAASWMLTFWLQQNAIVMADV